MASYSEGQFFQNDCLAPRLLLSMCPKRKVTAWKKMLFREIPNTPQSLEWHSSKVTCENLLNVSKKPFKFDFKIPVKMSICMSKSKQLFNFRNTFYVTEWFEQPEFIMTKKCLSKFYVSVRRKDGRNSLLSVRAAFDRHQKSPPYRKKISICEVFL